jgi:drug/metabolite transporter (DMT)-like permease
MIGELAGLAAAVSFGLSTVLARRFMPVVPPGAGVLVSIVANVIAFGIASVVLAIGGVLPPIAPWSLVLFASGGLLGSLIGRNLSYLSLNRLGASLTVTVRLSNGIFSLLIAFVVLREFPGVPQLLGMVIVTLGLWLSVQPDAPPGGVRRRVDPGGVLMALASAAAFALGDTVRRAGLHLTPAPIVGAAIGATAAMLAHLAWSIFNHAARWPPGAALRRFDIQASAVLNTVAILLLYVGLQHAPVAIVSALYNLQILVVLLAGPLVLRGQERLTAKIVAGALVALAGATLILIG